MNLIEGKLQVINGKKIAIVSTRWNHFIVDRLVEGATDAFARHGGNEEDITQVIVPGAFELPMIVDQLLCSGKYDAVCALGAVIRGATPHFDYISAEATKGIATMSLKYQKPVSFGLLTTDTIEQAIERAGTKAGNKGFEAMTTVIEMLNLYEEL
ncbi:MAG TPA: 6,7-dimethyl-8-ribityllumazine synthase [Sulfurimonas sp.]|nr:MAG: 6,7-dimethyl-8-ribityllumazine synthase [uncultured Sulfurimonas sp.]CAI6153039.1 MAG: 6,7-dimethyl-8-ribityllumazine synthase [uncultured Sulfurimonas sp.]HIC12092.1 6,7-dimethyl-8-ribityllumazine synthase [Sulfurimonas sp.]HIM75193.1 6,7-dimethyl-8-ribityllumazine synthase [Campylobacterales bacterium]